MHALTFRLASRCWAPGAQSSWSDPNAAPTCGPIASLVTARIQPARRCPTTTTTQYGSSPVRFCPAPPAGGVRPCVPKHSAGALPHWSRESRLSRVARLGSRTARRWTPSFATPQALRLARMARGLQFRTGTTTAFARCDADLARSKQPARRRGVDLPAQCASVHACLLENPRQLEVPLHVARSRLHGVLCRSLFQRAR